MSFKDDALYRVVTEALSKERQLYRKDLTGLSYRWLKKQRGLAGGSSGAASPCKRLSAEERSKVEAQMAKEGRL